MQVATNQGGGDIGLTGGIVTRHRELQRQRAVDVGDHDAVLLLAAMACLDRQGVGGEVKRRRPGDFPALQVIVVPLGLNRHPFRVAQADIVQIVTAELHGLPGGVGAAEVVFETVTDDNHVPPSEDGHPPVGGQTHGVDADDGGIQRQVGVADRRVGDGVGINRDRFPDFAVLHRVRVVPVFAFVASSSDEAAKAHPHHACFVVNAALDIAALNLAARIRAHTELAAGERGSGDVQRGRAHRCRGDTPHRLVHRVALDRPRQGQQAHRAAFGQFDHGNAGLVVDAARFGGGTGGGIEAVVEFTTPVKVGLAAGRKADAAGDNALVQGGQQIDTQDAAGRLFRASIFRLLAAIAHRHHKAVVNRRTGKGIDVFKPGKDKAVKRLDGLLVALGADDALAHRLLAVDGFGDAGGVVRFEFDGTGRVVNVAEVRASAVNQPAAAVVAHGDVGVHLPRVGLALLHLVVVVLDQHVKGHLKAARLDLPLREVEGDVAVVPPRRCLKLLGLRFAHRVIHFHVKMLVTAREVRQRNVAAAVVHRPRPCPGDIAHAVILRGFGAIVRPA